MKLVTARKRSLRRLCFHWCLSVHMGGGVCPIACWDTHPQADTPLGRDPPPRHPSRQTPRADTPSLGPQADTPHTVHARIRSTSGR